MGKFFTPANRELVVPGTDQRVLRQPDMRYLVQQRLSGAPLYHEVDYDDLVIHRSWRSYDDRNPGEVKYFMFEMSQRDPGERAFSPVFFKAIRMIRLTRVPRYLRLATAANGPNMVFEQMRDVLAALREQGVLFVNMIVKSPQMPLVFAYGVQGIGNTPEEAQRICDEAFAVLDFQLSGTYQQLMYKPITIEEGELISRYSAEWRQLAMGRGRPMPAGASLGTPSILDGNRTDVESTNNQLESFIRGMSDKSFMLTLLTVPLSPGEITLAWRNLTQKLTEVRSETSGSRSVSLGVAIPLVMGTNDGVNHGTTHSAGSTIGTGTNEGVSTSAAHGITDTSTTGTSTAEGTSSSWSTGTTDTSGTSASNAQGQAETITDGTTYGASRTDTAGTSQSIAVGQTDSVSKTDGVTHSVGVSQGQSVSVGQTYTDSVSNTVGQSVSASVSNTVGSSASTGVTNTVGESVSNSDTTTVGQSVGANHGTSTGTSSGSNWSDSASATTGTTATSGTSDSTTNSASVNDGTNAGSSTGSSVSGGIPGVANGGSNTGESTGWSSGTSTGTSDSTGTSASNANSASNTTSSTSGGSTSSSSGSSEGTSVGTSASQSVGQTTGASVSQAVNSSVSNSASQTVGLSNSVSASQTVGQSLAQSVTASNSVSTSESVATSQSVSVGQSVSQTATNGVSASTAMGTSVAQSQSLGHTSNATATSGVSASRAASETSGTGSSVTDTSSVSTAKAASVTNTDGTSKGTNTSQAFNDAYAVALGRSSGASASLAVAPNMGVAISRNTFDAAKDYIGDMLEAQMRRYSEGIKSGAFLYQMFLQCPDRETLLGGAGLLKSAFWGAGMPKDQLPQPFHTIVEFEDEERDRLLLHATCYTSYRRREPTAELIEPFIYSTYLTPTEAAAFTHPPAVEGPGLLNVHDSMPVLRMPMDRQSRDLTMGYVVNGERGLVSDIRFGLDIDELKNHALIAGVTGSGKTTTLMRMLTEAVRIERTVVAAPTAQNPVPEAKTLRASILALDWMRNMRDLASLPDLVNSGRFRFYSVLKPELGAFRFNPLEVPAEGMSAAEWLNAQADNFTASFNLGEFGRSLIAEYLTDLFSANRLEPYTLRPELIDEGTGQVMRPAIVLPAIPREQIPAHAIQIDAAGREVANVFTYPQLSRTISLGHLAVIVANKIEFAATTEGARLLGQSMRDRLQSLWRRVQYFAPGGQYSDMLGADPDLATRVNLGVTDLIDPDRGLVSVIETDGLDMEARRLILGSVMLAIYRYGLYHGKGVFDHDGRGPGCFVVLEESHELFGEAASNEDSYSASTRTALYEGMFRRVRALGLRLIAVAQQPSTLPSAVTANINNVFIHKVRAKEDRETAFSLLNWSNTIGQNLREYRYLGELPTGYCIARLDAVVDYTESAPVQFQTEPALLAEVPDAYLAELARRHS